MVIKKQRWLFLLLIIALIGCMSAPTTPISEGVSGKILTPQWLIKFNDWVQVSVLAALISFFSVALVYALAIGFHSKSLKTWADGELPQVIASLLLVFSLIGIVLILDSVSLELVRMTRGAIPANCGIVVGEPCTFYYAKTYISDLIDVANYGAHDVLMQSVAFGREASILKGYYGQLQALLWPGFFYGPNAGLSMMVDRFELIFDAYIKIMSLLAVQRVFLDYAIYGIVPLFLALGVFLRTFFFTRKLGGLLLAIAVGLLIVWPLLYILSWFTLAVTVRGLDILFVSSEPDCPLECTIPPRITYQTLASQEISADSSSSNPPSGYTETGYQSNRRLFSYSTAPRSFSIVDKSLVRWDEIPPFGYEKRGTETKIYWEKFFGKGSAPAVACSDKCKYDAYVENMQILAAPKNLPMPDVCRRMKFPENESACARHLLAPSGSGDPSSPLHDLYVAYMAEENSMRSGHANCPDECKIETCENACFVSTVEATCPDECRIIIPPNIPIWTLPDTDKRLPSICKNNKVKDACALCLTNEPQCFIHSCNMLCEECPAHCRIKNFPPDITIPGVSTFILDLRANPSMMRIDEDMVTINGRNYLVDNYDCSECSSSCLDECYVYSCDYLCGKAIPKFDYDGKPVIHNGKPVYDWYTLPRECRVVPFPADLGCDEEAYENCPAHCKIVRQKEEECQKTCPPTVCPYECRVILPMKPVGSLGGRVDSSGRWVEPTPVAECDTSVACSSSISHMCSVDSSGAKIPISDFMNCYTFCRTDPKTCDESASGIFSCSRIPVIPNPYVDSSGKFLYADYKADALSHYNDLLKNSYKSCRTIYPQDDINRECDVLCAGCPDVCRTVVPGAKYFDSIGDEMECGILSSCSSCPAQCRVCPPGYSGPSYDGGTIACPNIPTGTGGYLCNDVSSSTCSGCSCCPYENRIKGYTTSGCEDSQCPQVCKAEEPTACFSFDPSCTNTGTVPPNTCIPEDGAPPGTTCSYSPSGCTSSDPNFDCVDISGTLYCPSCLGCPPKCRLKDTTGNPIYPKAVVGGPYDPNCNANPTKTLCDDTHCGASCKITYDLANCPDYDSSHVEWDPSAHKYTCKSGFTCNKCEGCPMACRITGAPTPSDCSKYADLCSYSACPPSCKISTKTCEEYDQDAPTDLNCKKCPEECRLILPTGALPISCQDPSYKCEDSSCPRACKADLSSLPSPPTCQPYTPTSSHQCSGCPWQCRLSVVDLGPCDPIHQPNCFSGTCLSGQVMCDDGSCAPTLAECPAQVYPLLCPSDCKPWPPRHYCDNCLQCDPDCTKIPAIRTDCEDLCAGDPNVAQTINAKPSDFIGSTSSGAPADIESVAQLYIPAVVLPIMNIVLLVALVRVLSNIMGGDVEIPGLRRLI